MSKNKPSLIWVGAPVASAPLYTPAVAARYERLKTSVDRHLMQLGLDADVVGVEVEDGHISHKGAARGQSPAAWRIIVILRDGSCRVYGTVANRDGAPILDALGEDVDQEIQ